MGGADGLVRAGTRVSEERQGRYSVLLLFRIWTNPAAAMSAILDRGSLLFASIAVLAATALLKFTAPGSASSCRS